MYKCAFCPKSYGSTAVTCSAVHSTRIVSESSSASVTRQEQACEGTRRSAESRRQQTKGNSTCRSEDACKSLVVQLASEVAARVLACDCLRATALSAIESSSDENSSDREDEVQAKKDDDDDGDDNDNKGARAPANDDHDDDGEAEDNALTRNAGSGVLARHMTLHSIYDREHC
jgi:hypothetical protein